MQSSTSPDQELRSHRPIRPATTQIGPRSSSTAYIGPRSSRRRSSKISSKIFDRIPARRENIPFDIHPESQDEINDQRRAHGEKGNINKPGTDPRRGDAHSVTDGRTYPKDLPFNEVLQSIHNANLKKINKPTAIYVITLTHF
jgi:hypothetical protein